MKTKSIPKRKTVKHKVHVNGDYYLRNIGAVSELSISSASSIFTILSSSATVIPACCGRLCCLRRFEYELTRRYCLKCRRKIMNSYMKNTKTKKNKKKLGRNMASKVKKSEANQIGSRSNMLSPLYVTSNAHQLAKQPNEPISKYGEITPEMIYDALRKLTMWKQSVLITDIVDYLIQNFPVNTNRDALLEELGEKLDIADMAGIASKTPNGTWYLSDHFQKRKLTKNHVTVFWKMYVDILKPIVRKESKELKERRKKSTIFEKENTLTIHDEDII